MRPRAVAPVLFAMLLALPMAGCLVVEDAPPDGDGPPPVHEGTTVGLRLPEVAFTDHTGQSRSLRAIDADVTILHIDSPRSAPFPPQYAQLRWVRARLTNVTVATVTLSADSGSTYLEMAALRTAMGADWDFGVPQGDLNYTLSLLRAPTVLVLDRDKVVLARADEPLGQGRILEAVRATWGEAPDPSVGPEVGKRAPELVWRDIEGREGSLSGLGGSVVLVDVWQILCPWCIEQFVSMRELLANYSSRGLAIVSPDVVYWETDGEVRAVAEANNATWTFAVDGDNVQSRYQVLRVPSLFLVDREGMVRWTHVGYASYEALAQEQYFRE
jgi:peroxiredoxin